MFSTSVRDGRGGEERCEWKTPSSIPSSSRNQISGSASRGRSDRARLAALIPGSYRSATPSSITTSPQASFGASASACSLSARRVSGGHYHQTVFSIDSSTSFASQKSAERYFQPRVGEHGDDDALVELARRASAPRGRPRPAETPPKIAFAVEQHAQAGDRLGVRDEHLAVELRHVEDRRHVAVRERAQTHHGSPGSGSAAATTTSGNDSRSRVARPHQRAAGAEARRRARRRGRAPPRSRRPVPS